MQFLVSAHDGTDAQAQARRLAARPAHLELGRRLRTEGRHLYGVALLDEAGQMTGSVLIVDYPSRAELDAWLAEEPYVTGKVWERIVVSPCRVGPAFLDQDTRVKLEGLEP
ncbi:MAG: YciI family protein [bacterium]|jgi:hypothetical protein|nr:YciI family protein [bacterium]